MSEYKKIKIILKLIQELNQRTFPEIGVTELTTMEPLLELPHIGHRLYSFTANSHPQLMHELALIRELCWKAYGCGSNKETDLDFYDTNPASCYQQLLVWNSDTQRIIGGCRYVSLVELQRKLGTLPVMPAIRTCEMFELGKTFYEQQFPRLLEIQRLFVIPQKANELTSPTGRHSSNVVDSIFKGLGVICSRDKITCMTGRVLISPFLFSVAENDRLLSFLHQHFAAYGIMYPKPVFTTGAAAYLADKYSANTRNPNHRVAKLDRNIINQLPTLLKTYLTLAETFYFLGAVTEPELGNSLEIAIMLVLRDLKKSVMRRYLKPEFVTEITRLEKTVT